MAGRKAIKAINWSALAERVSEAEKNSLSAFRAKSDQYLRMVQAHPETSPKIDWAFYKSKIVAPGLVDKFQKEYEALSIPFPQDKYTSQIDAEEKEALQGVKKFIDESNKRIEESKAEIKKLEGLLKYGQMTMEDFKDAHPDLAFDVNKPTIYPHTQDFQPNTNGEEEKHKSH